ncbi:MAG TPA: hypothetical protein VLL08_11240 [Kineosporiaceae bacterium]|nr:hypothetical protein [Kineosporiaceae bacterium]
MTTDLLMQRFLAFSAEVTAFGSVDLHGTGQAPSYLNTVVGVVGEGLLGELLDVYQRTVDEESPDRRTRTQVLSRELFSDEKLGPIARNIIKLWYVGVWFELPSEWTETFGALENDGTFTASPQAYPEGLLWRAIGANPPGARAPGYGSWAEPPRIPAFVV